MKAETGGSGFQFTGRMFLVGIVVFFGIVIAANLIMANYALGEFDGVVEEDAYRKGRDYNDVLDAAKAQAALGWQDRHSFEAGTFVFHLQDDGGAPVGDISVELEVRRPARADLDQRLTLAPGPDGGWLTRVDLPLAGLWYFRVHVSRGGEKVFRRDIEIMKP